MTALQPLTDVQVKNRLNAYNADGALERDVRGLWDAASDIISECAATHFGEAAGAAVERHYTSRVDAAGCRMSPTSASAFIARSSRCRNISHRATS